MYIIVYHLHMRGSGHDTYRLLASPASSQLLNLGSKVTGLVRHILPTKVFLFLFLRGSAAWPWEPLCDRMPKTARSQMCLPRKQPCGLCFELSSDLLRMQRLDAMHSIFQDFVLEGLMLLNAMATIGSLLEDSHAALP